jgi:hypothetical protein
MDEMRSVSLPEQLLSEWKFLVGLRSQVEGKTLDPIKVLRQAIATENYFWRQKELEARIRDYQRSLTDLD